MLEYRRYRDAAAHLSGLFADGRRYLYRAAPLPPELRRASLEAATRVYEPQRLGEALGACFASPRRRTPATSGRPSRSSAGSGSCGSSCRGRGSFDFDEVFADEDRLTQAVTLFALLEMHKRGEASWEQRELFGPIEVRRTAFGSSVRRRVAR